MSKLGVVIVSYNAGAHISKCLSSLLDAAVSVELEIVVVDNASQDNTVALLEPFRGKVDVIQSSQNQGFAAGVNIGLRALLADPTVDNFWILNPDTIVAKGTPDAFLRDDKPYAMKSGRICYEAVPNYIQIDGGQINYWTGATSNINLGMPPDGTALPKPHNIHFVSGASLVVSRQFIETVGLMPEDYFLYYEEVDWALRKTGLPFVVCADAIVFHAAGASIGSPTLTQSASPFSVYFKSRSRIRFIRRFAPRRVLTAYLYGFALAARFMMRGEFEQADALLRGQHGMLPPAGVSKAISEDTFCALFSGGARPLSQ